MQRTFWLIATTLVVAVSAGCGSGGPLEKRLSDVEKSNTLLEKRTFDLEKGDATQAKLWEKQLDSNKKQQDRNKTYDQMVTEWGQFKQSGSGSGERQVVLGNQPVGRGAPQAQQGGQQYVINVPMPQPQPPPQPAAPPQPTAPTEPVVDPDVLKKLKSLTGRVDTIEPIVRNNRGEIRILKADQQDLRNRVGNLEGNVTELRKEFNDLRRGGPAEPLQTPPKQENPPKDLPKNAQGPNAYVQRRWHPHYGWVTATYTLEGRGRR